MPEREAEAERLPALLGYYRGCLRREAVLNAECDLATGDPAAAVCLPAGPEPLFSGAKDALPLPPAARSLVSASARRGGGLRYGYPLVVLPARPGGSESAAAPLLTADIEVVEDGAGLRARAVSRVDVNPVLLRALGVDSTAEVTALRRWLRRGAPVGLVPVRPENGTPVVSAALVDRTPRGRHARPGPAPGAAVPYDLEHTVRALLVRLGVERIDPILPARLRDALPAPGSLPGARNVAVVYRAAGAVGSAGAGHAGAAGSPIGLRAVLDREAAGGLRPNTAASTALGALLGEPGRPCTETAVPVSATPLDEARHRVLRAALREPLTVAAAPPGTGGAELVDAVVRTAAAAGRRVVVGGGDDHVLDRIARRAGDPPGHTMMRAGGSAYRAAEAAVLERLRDRAAFGCAPDTGVLLGGAPVTGVGRGAAAITGAAAGLPAATTGAAADTAAPADDLREAWTRIEAAWRAADESADAGHTLALLAAERRGLVDFGWRPDSLFDSGREGPAYWLERAERALAGGFGGAKHRTAIRRELGIDPYPENLRWLCRAARVERDWREARQRRGERPPDRLLADLAAAGDDHRAAAADFADRAAAERIARARSAIKNRLESLNWFDSATAAGADAAGDTGEPADGPAACPGFVQLLAALPAWAVNTRSTRSLPDQAALFDLAIIVDADQLTVPELIPLLYRAKRALVIGDPERAAQWTALEADEDERLMTEAGLSASWLDRHALGFRRHSAYDAAAVAAASAGRPPLWLAEHRTCHPQIAGVAARHCYGGRFTVLSRPTDLSAPAALEGDVPARGGPDARGSECGPAVDGAAGAGRVAGSQAGRRAEVSAPAAPEGGGSARGGPAPGAPRSGAGEGRHIGGWPGSGGAQVSAAVDGAAGAGCVGSPQAGPRAEVSPPAAPEGDGPALGGQVPRGSEDSALGAGAAGGRDTGGCPGSGGSQASAAVEWRHGIGECESVPGGVCLNRVEAHRTVFAAQELVRQAPALSRVGVFAPVQPQRALLRRLLDRRGPTHSIGVYGPLDLLDDEDDTVDLLVVSAVCSGARLPQDMLERVRAARTWSGALARTVERLVIVGDRAFWRGESGPLAELARSLDAGSEPVPDSPAVRTLSRVLRESGARVQSAPYLHGYRADLRVVTPRRTLLVLVDQARTGEELRRLAARAELLGRIAGEPVVRVPAWRCLHEPEALVGELGRHVAGACE